MNPTYFHLFVGLSSVPFEAQDIKDAPNEKFSYVINY